MSKNYCIFRVGKLKNHAAVVNILKEQHRAEDFDAFRADKEMSHRNTYSDTYENAIQKYDGLLPSKIRKNAVVGLNFLISTSEEFDNAADETMYYQNARNFIEKRFGTIVGWAIHRDETSTHMQVVTIPLKDGKLNARELIGGSKNRLRDFQNDFYVEVGMPMGLDRGEVVEKTKANHMKVEQLHREQMLEMERLETEKKYLSEAQKRLSERSEEVSREETLLAEKKAEIDARGAILADYMQTAKDNSLGVLQECDKAEEVYFLTKPKDFFQSVKKAITGAWSLVKKMQMQIEKLTKKNEMLEAQNKLWREETTPEEFREIADTLEKNRCQSWKQYDDKQARKRSQSVGYLD